MIINIFSLLIGIAGAAFGACAIFQSYKYNKQTEQIQKHIENILNNSTFLNTYTFLNVRELIKEYNRLSDKENIIIFKDTIIFNKAFDYSKDNSKKCLDIIYNTNIIKFKVFGDDIKTFLNNNESTLHITLRSDLQLEDIDKFLNMSSELLNYGVCVLHNIHF